jgi:transcriptional regulator with XRE-family HTH domain
MVFAGWYFICHRKQIVIKNKLYSDLARGTVDIREATWTMRKIIGLTQAEYAKKVAKISPRILSEFERGIGNPTIDTLDKIGKPFGLRVSFLPPEAWRIEKEDRSG